MPRIIVRKRHSWWWVSLHGQVTSGTPFRTWREAYDYALTVAPWPKWFNGRS